MTIEKKIFITGASGGIGLAICEKFEKENFILILTSSSQDKINFLKNKFGSNHFYYQVDISDSKSLQNCIDKLSNDHKNISVIVNNAGITEDNLIFRMKSDQWFNVIQTNLNSNYQVIKSLLPNMLSRRYGKIIGISSIVASTGNAGQVSRVIPFFSASGGLSTKNTDFEFNAVIDDKFVFTGTKSFTLANGNALADADPTLFQF